MDKAYFRKKFKNQKILVTGHTGFKGSYLLGFLKIFSSKVLGVSCNTHKNFNELKLNKNIKNKIFKLEKFKTLDKTIKKFRPKYVFHLAAQPLVYNSIVNPSETWDSNLISTINLLKVAKHISSIKYIIIITSDKVYSNRNNKVKKKEVDYLNGNEAYSMSKVSVENYVKFMSNSIKNKKIITVRAGNVVGGGDWAEKRLVPDILRSIKNKKKLKIRNINAIRPWFHVLDCIHGYLFLASKMNSKKIENGSSWNIGNNSKKYFKTKNIIELFKKEFDSFKVENEKNKFHERNFLMINTNKIKDILNWKSIYNFDKTIKKTIIWSKKYFTNSENISINQIEEYLNERKKIQNNR